MRLLLTLPNGDWKLNVIHTKLRYQCSSLNYDLFRVNLVETPSIAVHLDTFVKMFITIFSNVVYILLRELPGLMQHLNNTMNSEIPCDVDLLLFSNEDLLFDCNSELCSHVHPFIKTSNIF